ncbi:MAG: GNAT family N-acetyltransferase [Chryseolinea sp.]
MVTYTTSVTQRDLEGILDLQKRNLPANLSKDEFESQGFVTVQHSMKDLKKMNDIERHVIARANDEVVAYLLAMTTLSRNDIPVLVPMFKLLENLLYKGSKLSAQNYIVIGQACVDKLYRGEGVFDGIYRYYRERFHSKYDFALTEIATSNPRSIRAHQRVGFKSIHQYIAPDGQEWSIVVLDWK